MLTREALKSLFLRHSENSANDYVRDGRIGVDDHAVLIETIKASRMEWHEAQDHVFWRVNHGFLTPAEGDLVLSVCAEYCPSPLD